MVEAGKRETERGVATCDDTKYPAHSNTQRPRCRPISTRTENNSFRGSPQDEEDDFYSQIQVGTRRQLVSDLSVQLENDSIYKIATGKHVPLNGPFDILIIGDPFYKPAELAVIPEVQTLEPGEEIFISVMCLDYPYFLPANVPIAQAFLLPKPLPETVPQNPTVLWVQIRGSKKPIYKGTLFSKGEKVKRLGVMDTGADVTLVAKSEWPPYWELEPVAGFISGIGGVATSWRAKRNVVISGLEGKWDGKLRDPLLILEWIFLHAQPNKTITTPQEAIAAIIRKELGEKAAEEGQLLWRIPESFPIFLERDWDLDMDQALDW
ncbi:hypothetical protein HGM15179_015288 [Zosterops borbonicus]|uniref:Peptidase A2 domain-containing protein n=1 Tax=Zosterops borbonicus TaxID=364589 RepID=A0A8K1G552_9PASS|nr:hypothetical protein HGM15179_015288 [Zosterops borbonicus]